MIRLPCKKGFIMRMSNLLCVYKKDLRKIRCQEKVAGSNIHKIPENIMECMWKHN